MEIQRTIVFQIAGVSYKADFPSVGKFLEIESKRMLLSNGSYTSMLRSNLISSGMALDLIDIIATMTVLCPELIKNIKADSIVDMDIQDMSELIDAYNTTIRPWMDGWMGVFQSVLRKKEE